MKTNVFKKTNMPVFVAKAILKNFFLAFIIMVVFGYAFSYVTLNVVSSSMAPVMPINTIVIVKKTNISTLEVGDVITYNRSGGQNAYNKQTTNVTHRVVGFDTATGGVITAPESVYRHLQQNPDITVTTSTQGVDTGGAVLEHQVVGIVVAHFVGMGNFFDFLSNNIIIITIGLVLLLFVLNFM